MTKSRDSCLRRRIGLGGEDRPIRILAGGTIITQAILINRFSISCHSFFLSLPPRGAPLPFNLSAPPNPQPGPDQYRSGIAVCNTAMSLTSRVFGLFSTATSDSTAPPAGDLQTSIWTHSTPMGGIDDSNHSVRYGDLALLEDEEPRPPYLHVQLSPVASHHCARADLI